MILFPGYPLLARHINVPHFEQKKLSMVFPEAIVLSLWNFVSWSLPRTYLMAESLIMKLEANIEAVILRPEKRC